jgi:hypothetical protein
VKAILKEEDLLTLGFLTKELSDFPKEKHQAGRFWGPVRPRKAWSLLCNANLLGLWSETKASLWYCQERSIRHRPGVYGYLPE